MKKLLALPAILALALLLCGFHTDYMLQSTEKTADAAIDTGAGYFYGMILATDGTNAVTVDIYDNTSASGTVLVPTFVITTSATDRVRSLSFDPPVAYNNGVYVDITCAGTMSFVGYYRSN